MLACLLLPLALGACATAPQLRGPLAGMAEEPGDDSSVYGLYLAGEAALDDGSPAAAAGFFGEASRRAPETVELKQHAFAAALLAGDVERAAPHPPPPPAARARPAGAAAATTVVGGAGWERTKAAEREAKGEVGRVLDGVPLALPGLTRAVKLQKKASRVAFDWGDVRLVLAKIREETDEIAEAFEEDALRRKAAVADEIGDLLFAVANLARHAGIDPEAAVRGTNVKFERRFAFIEDRLAERGSAPARSSLEEMDGLWNEAKAAGL